MMAEVRTIANWDLVNGTWFPGKSAEVEWKAAEGWIRSRCRWPEVAVQSDGSTVELAPPAELVEAVRILTHRYLERRSSPTGVLGMDDMGAVRLPGSDADVQSLIAPWRPVVFG